ncbi:MAG: hypothetical protein ABIS18_09980 [Actinomycetota bacterium]
MVWSKEASTIPNLPRAFRDAAGVVERTGRGKLRFSGDQSCWFLDQLLTNRVEDLGQEQVRDALLLTPKGKIVATLRLSRPNDDVFADVDGESASDLLDFFNSRIFTTRVAIEDVTQSYAILSVLGPDAAGIVNTALQGTHSVENENQCCAFTAGTAGAAGFLVGVERPIGGIDIWVRSAEAPQLVASLTSAGATLLTESDLGALQVVEGSQVAGLDFDQTFLPQEAGLERAVHFNKGCYLGQESVAMAQRGSVKRKLRHLRFHSEPIAPQIRVARDEDRYFGISAVKTSVVVGSETLIGETLATVMEMPGSVEGPTPPSARELRERLQAER